MSVKLPVLAEPHARPVRASVPFELVDLDARARAARTLIAVLGAPGDEAPVRFACALSTALVGCARYAVLGAEAPRAFEQSLRATGADVLRLPVTKRDDVDAVQHALQHALTAVPAAGVVLVVESALALQLRAALEVWVGVAPSVVVDPQLAALCAASDASFPGPALAVASALGAVLAPRLAEDTRQSAAFRINDHTSAP